MGSVDDAATHISALMDDFFRAVSFQEGERPSYANLHEMFIEGGKLIKNNSDSPEVSTVEEFVAPRQKMVDSGELTSFREAESAEITEIFGNVAHRFSTYEKRGTMNGHPFEAKGIISTQFIRTPHGWKMSSMAWDDERSGLTIPERYR